MSLTVEWLWDWLEAIAAVFFGPPEDPAVTENRVLRARLGELKLVEENILLRREIALLEKAAEYRQEEQ